MSIFFVFSLLVFFIELIALKIILFINDYIIKKIENIKIENEFTLYFIKKK